MPTAGWEWPVVAALRTAGLSLLHQQRRGRVRARVRQPIPALDERHMLVEVHDEMFKGLDTRVDGNPVRADAEGAPT